MTIRLDPKRLKIIRDGLWFGLGSGLLESAFQAFRRFHLGRVLNASPHIVWMAPLVSAALFLLLALLMVLVSLFLTSISDRQIYTTVFAFFAFLTFHFLRPKLHILAALLLCVGLAIQAGYLAGKFPHWEDRMIRLSLPIFLLILGGTIVTMLALMP
jgi:hypothetical protein